MKSFNKLLLFIQFVLIAIGLIRNIVFTVSYYKNLSWIDSGGEIAWILASPNAILIGYFVLILLVTLRLRRSKPKALIFLILFTLIGEYILTSWLN